ncbi:MAG: hypothetical protein ACREEB_02835, partial [Caulobacteraceae bacterium]
ESFIRYESGNPAFSRVTPSGGLQPCTFAAPSGEGVQSQAALSESYNLPDPDIARGTYFEVNPPAGTPVIGPGPVSGGTGSEVEFPFGVGPGSVGPPIPTLPEVKMLALSKKWEPILASQPETGMGYQVATVSLIDGRKYSKVTIVGGYITKIGDSTAVPFEESDIKNISVEKRR